MLGSGGCDGVVACEEGACSFGDVGCFGCDPTPGCREVASDRSASSPSSIGAPGSQRNASASNGPAVFSQTRWVAPTRSARCITSSSVVPATSPIGAQRDIAYLDVATWIGSVFVACELPHATTRPSVS